MDDLDKNGVLQHWEAPDIVNVRYVGALRPEHLNAARDEAASWIRGVPYFFTLLDVTKLGAVSTEARRAMAQNGENAKHMRGIAIVGASFHFRALGNMVAKAIAILHRHADNPVRFFETEEEARAWLEERRQIVHAARSAAPQ